MAAKLLGRSVKAISRMVANGNLPDHSPHAHTLIPLDAIERHRGRPVSPEEYLEADRALDAERSKQARERTEIRLRPSRPARAG